MSLLDVRNLTVALPPGADRPHAVEDVSFTLDAGEILCIVGESGSGKSVSAGAIMGLLPPALKVLGGGIEFEGRDVLGLKPTEMRLLRGSRIGMIFQEPMTALNPLMRVGDQIAEVLKVHGVAGSTKRVQELIEAVQLPDPDRIARSYPHLLSGGQRQRVMIAMALALEPAVLIADEPTTALDVTTQMQILGLIKEIQSRRGMGVLFITHDFGVVAEIADRVAVMQRGRIVESGPAKQVLNRPRHDYTKALIAAVPHRARAIEAPATGRPVLELIGVRKTYWRSGGLLSAKVKVSAVKDADIALRKGETLGLVGESGSGKSTLARCIVNLVKPEEGAIRFHDTDLRRRGLSEAKGSWKTIWMRLR
jgi:ABC-type glutathione transport system ATPase component